MNYPKRLKTGDKVGIIAPSGPVPYNRLDLAVEKVKRMGLKPIEGESFRAKKGYLAGGDHVRAADINNMFKRKDISGIFCARGGYGSQRIIHLLDFETIKENPKIFAGYSDITALHIAINQNCNFITYHSPMIGSELYKEDENSYSFQYFKDSIFLEPRKIFKGPFEKRAGITPKGTCGGILTGGNLSVIVSSIGTPYEIDTKGKILFLEEVDEELYKVDRMLNQLKNANKLEEASGFALGYFVFREDNQEYENAVMDLIREYLEPFNKPVVYNICAGHRLPSGTLPLGAISKIQDGNLYFDIRQ